MFDLLGERYQTALSQLALGRLAARTGAYNTAQRSLDLAILGEERQAARFEPVGAREDVRPRRMMKGGGLRMPFDERDPGWVRERKENRAAPVGIARAHDATLPRGMR